MPEGKVLSKLYRAGKIKHYVFMWTQNSMIKC